MKMNLSLLKLTIRLLILLVLLVILFLISTVIYSARYWPDVYNYLHANVKIKRIPTITELNHTIYVVRATETYTTTDDATEYSWVTESDFDGINLDDIDFEKKKRQIELDPKDYSEVPAKAVLVDYFFDLEEQTTKLIKDLIDESKLTTTNMKDVETLIGFKSSSLMNGINDEAEAKLAFPWIAAIFEKNDTNNQFNYHCDGTLLSDKAIITAASCVTNNNGIVNSDDLIVLLGKKSLATMAVNEKAVRIKQIIVSGNYTGDSGGDLAVLVTEDPIQFNKVIKAARLDTGAIEEFETYLTTGWAVTGELTPIYLKTGEDDTCDQETQADDIFCAAYGNDITVCPSYGGVFMAKAQDSWYLQGVRTGDPSDRGLCVNRNIAFTSLAPYLNWIKDNMN